MTTVLQRTLREERRFLLWLLLAAAAGLSANLGGAELATAFPYGLLGLGLRRLSLASAAGNALAWAGLLVLGAIPAGVWLWLRRRNRLRRGDWALWVFVPVLWLTLYAMVNPAWLAQQLLLSPTVDMTAAVQSALALTVDSFLLLYLALRLMDRAAEGETALTRALILALRLTAVVCVGFAFADPVPELFACAAEWSGLLSSHTIILDESSSPSLGALLEPLLSALALLLDGWIALVGASLLRLLGREPYGEDAVALARSLAAFCRAAVTALLAALALSDLITLLTLDGGGHVRLSLPVFSIAFSLLMLFASRALADRRALKQENDLFI